MITDERITELWNLASNTATSKPDWTYSEIIFATVRAVIAEHDAELRKQEPVAWMACSGSGTTVLPDERMNKDYYNIPLYAAPIAPEPTPSQQARPLDEWDEWNGNVLWWKFPIDEPPYVGTPLDTDWPKYHTHWTPLGVPDMPLPARPDEVTKNDRNKDGAIEFIDAVVLNKPIWPNPWGQDVAFCAFKMHTDTNRIAELEALRTEHRWS